jgi:ribosomal protein S18 acetylase RimI-like enzyme
MMESQPEPVFRRATAADIPAIVAITRAAYTKYVARLGREPQPMTTDYDQILASHPIWLLCLAGEPAGVLVLMHEPEALLIYSVAISPPYQKHGFGRQLLAWADGQARQAGYAVVRLFTNALMTENIALYQRLGYAETGRESFQGFSLVHMAKLLGPADDE